MTHRYRLAVLSVVALAALSVAAAACGGEEKATPSPAARQYATPPAMTIDPKKSYVAVLETDKGTIRIKLLPDIAPQTVNSFVFLAREGYFDGVTFHRVISGFMAQGGDPKGTGYGGPGYNLPDEFSDTPIDRGVVAMANTGQPNSGGSQFFIEYVRRADLDGKYTVFGEVSEGLDVAEKLTPRDPQTNLNAPPGDRMIKVTIEEQ